MFCRCAEKESLIIINLTVVDLILYSYDAKSLVDVVPTDIPAMIMFGGYKTLYSRIVLYDLQTVADLLKQNNVDAGIYGALYKIPNMCSNLSRKNKERVSLSTVLLSSKCFRNYINTLVDILIIPRIKSINGEKLPVDVAEKNMRGLTVFAYCYGVYVADCLGGAMNKSMKRLKYSDDEIAKILKQFVVITQSPSYILYDKKFTVLNFASAKDTTVLYKSVFQNISELTYFPEYNFVIQPQVYRDDYISVNLKRKKDVEHRLWTVNNYGYIMDYNIINLLHLALCNAIKFQSICDTKSLLESNVHYSIQHKDDIGQFFNGKMVIKSLLNRLTRYK